MKVNEFSEWLAYHMARFTGLRSWMSKMCENDREAVRDAWRKVLASVDLDDAKAASDEMFADSDQPRGFDKHPAAIRARAMKRAGDRPQQDVEPKYVDGVEVFKCLACRDEGIISGWHPKTVAKVQAGNPPFKGWYYTAAFACGECERGERPKRQGLAVFDRRRHVLHDGCSDLSPLEQIEAGIAEPAYPEFDF